MARTNNLTNFLTDVADAIKEKKGDNTPITAADFDTEIANLPSQGVYQNKSVRITTNGTQTVTPDDNYDAMTGVEIITQVPEKQLQTKSYEFTQNTNIEIEPDTGYDGFSKVGLNINVTTNLQSKTTTPTTSSQTITPDSGYTGLSSVTVNAVDNTIDENIVAGNIKKNVTILGVTGTLEEGSGSGDTILELNNLSNAEVITENGKNILVLTNEGGLTNG